MRAKLLAAVALAMWPLALVAAPAVTSDHFKIDQFGWLPGETKVALVSEPVVGFNAPAPFVPSPSLEIRRWSDDAVIFSAAPAPWNGGATQAQSGDRVWRLDFTSLRTPGSYYVFDPGANAGSYRFEISDSAQREALKVALHSILYQRCGMAKVGAHAGADWADATCHLGAQQDLACSPVYPPFPGLPRDLSGGWHDAGDYNKYINFADDPIHDLLLAYEDHPAAFDDAANISESGNGVPDVLDEVKWELDWFLKMQLADGSVLHKVSVTDYSAGSPPSTDSAPRQHAPPTASATISACGAFAHAAIVYRAQPDAASRAYADTLEAAARAAWAWLEANPGRIPSTYDNAGFLNAAAEDGAYEQDANRTCAAAYLFVLTGEIPFRQYFNANYANVHLLQWGYAYPFEALFQDGLLYYARAAGATSPVVADIQNAWVGSMSGNDNLGHVQADDDAYRAWLADGDYTWGSNRTKSQMGNMYLSMNVYALDSANNAAYRDAAAGYLHGLHGQNPLGLVYATNMSAAGAESSTRSLYHGWFNDGTDWDEVGVSRFGPAPGILPGGPNPSFQPDPSYLGPPIEPPENQPIQKSFREWNGGWPENSWEVTENQLAYQAAYIRLIAGFVPAAAPPPLDVTDPVDASACAGADAGFSVSASGGTPPLSYQWRLDSIDVAGATSSTVTLVSIDSADAGLWDCVVTDSAGSSVTSAAARLTVNLPPTSPGGSLRVRRNGADVLLSWAGPEPGVSYDVLRCDASSGPCTPTAGATVTPPAWTDIAPPERRLWYVVVANNTCGTTP